MVNILKEYLPADISQWLRYTPLLIFATLIKLIAAYLFWFYSILTAAQLLMLGIAYKFTVCLITSVCIGYHYSKRD